MSALAHIDHAIPTTAPNARLRPRTLRSAARVATAGFLMSVAIQVAGVLGLSLYATSHSDRIYEGVSMAGVEVGGLSVSDARSALDTRFRTYATQPITLEADGQTFQYTAHDLGLRADPGIAADQAFAYGRSGSFWHRSQSWVRGLLTSHSVSPRLDIDVTVLDAKLAEITPHIVRPARDAKVIMSAVGEPALIPDKPGSALDVGGSRHAIIRELTGLGIDPVKLVTRAQPAAVTVADLEAALPGARTAVGSPLVLNTTEGSWTIATGDLKQIVQATSTGVSIARAPLEAAVTRVAVEIDRPATDAGITVDEGGALVADPGADGATVNVGASTDAIIEALKQGRHDVQLTVDRTPPMITDQVATSAADDAEALIADGMKLIWQGGEGRIGRDDMLWALTITPQPGEKEPFAFGLDDAVLTELLGVVAEDTDRQAHDARYRIVDLEITAVGKASMGRQLDVPKGIEAIKAAFGKPKPSANLEIKDVKPAFGDTDIDKITLGEDILGTSVTYYQGSSEPRRQNVERAVQLEAGWLVPPGGVFSFVENVGAIDETNGFATGFGIVAGEGGGITTAPVIGGGICQVSTTIFQAAFWAGLPMLERYQHPYWLTGYGQPPSGLTGLDAMVNIEDDWNLDMKFENTTGGWIAVLVEADGISVVAKIVGTNPGWDITVDDPKITNIIPKDEKMVFTDSSELPAGQQLQVETAQDGFDAEIVRTVTDNGEVIDQYSLQSSYLPARNMTLRGTG